jgi:anti-sigma28 factor (negative regulator of flagellin synthesis)
MLEINPSSARPELLVGNVRDTRSDKSRLAQNEPAECMRDQDRVELSARAREHEAVQAAGDQRLAELRARIADGDYLTPDKIDYVVDRLRQELFGG